MNREVLHIGAEVAVALGIVVYVVAENRSIKARLDALEKESSTIAKYVKILELQHGTAINRIANSSGIQPVNSAPKKPQKDYSESEESSSEEPPPRRRKAKSAKKKVPVQEPEDSSTSVSEEEPEKEVPIPKQVIEPPKPDPEPQAQITAQPNSEKNKADRMARTKAVAEAMRKRREARD